MSLPEELSPILRDRKVGLWIGQAYELRPGSLPHSYVTPVSEARLRYRTGVEETDTRLASLYWQAVWIEGADSGFLRAYRAHAKTPTLRPLALLASASDAQAQLSSDTHLPIYALPGLFDSHALDGAFGTLPERARSNVAWSLGTHISGLAGGLLVVVGVSASEDLALLADLIASTSPRNLHVLLHLSSPAVEPPAIPNAAVSVFTGSLQELLNTLEDNGAAPAAFDPSQRIRVRASYLSLQAPVLHSIKKRFTLLDEPLLSSPTTLSRAHVTNFFSHSHTDWACYGSGILPAPREYLTDTGDTLSGDVTAALSRLDSGASPVRTFTYVLPAEPGSGATTELRRAAYASAREGYPTLVALPGTLTMDVEDVLAFATVLSDACHQATGRDLPPLLIVLDTPQLVGNPHLPRQLAQAMAAQGKRAVLLCARDSLQLGESHRTRSSSFAVLPTLESGATSGEVVACRDAFARLATQLEGGTASLPQLDWNSYSASMRIQGPSSYPHAATTSELFWVALQFYVQEGPAFLATDSVRSALARWITSRTSIATDPASRSLLTYIAALSSFRLVAPLTSVLRPLTGSTYSTLVTQSVGRLGALVEWTDNSADLDDQALHFRHPAIAQAFLRDVGIEGDEAVLHALEPVLAVLSPGSKGDIWLAEMLSATVFGPDVKRERYVSPWQLEAFRKLPWAVASQSKSVLHHWARALYRSTVNNALLAPEAKTQILLEAADKLTTALSLERRPGRDEHPGHIHNTLGAVYHQLALQMPSAQDAAVYWEDAWKAFSTSIAMLPGDNIIAYLSFSERLVTRARTRHESGAPTRDLVADAARAIALVDEAETAMQGMAFHDPKWLEDATATRSQALAMIEPEAAKGFIAALKESASPGLGYYCEARLALGDGRDESRANLAVAILTAALDESVDLSVDALRLLARLLPRSADARHDYNRQLTISRAIDNTPEGRTSLADQFRCAVLCFQCELYAEGNDRFRRLRDQARQNQSTNAPQRFADFLRDSNGKPRTVTVRVDRALTDWRGEGFVQQFGFSVPLRPRHFQPIAKAGHILEAAVRFEVWGPLAVPPRHELT